MSFEEQFPGLKGKHLGKHISIYDIEHLHFCQRHIEVFCIDRQRVSGAIDKWKRRVKEDEDHLLKTMTDEDTILDSDTVMELFDEMVVKVLGFEVKP